MKIGEYYKIVMKVLTLKSQIAKLRHSFFITQNNVETLAICVVFFVSVLPFSAFAQDEQNEVICHGLIRDAETGQELPGVSVYLFSSHSIGSITDIKGEYTLRIPKGKHRLIFSCIGYQTVKYDVKAFQGSSKEINVSMYPLSQALSEVNIIAKGKTQKMREVPSSVTILDSKILQGQVATFNEVLNRTVGVKVAQQGGLGSMSRILIQGLDGKRIGLFINGVPMGSLAEFSVSSIPVDAIQFVEIYKGIIPSKLGNDGLGGAINIILKSSIKNYFEVAYEVSSYNTHLCNFQINKNLNNNKLYFKLGGAFEFSSNNYDFMSPFEQGRIIHRDHDKYKHWQLHAGLLLPKSWFDKFSVNIGLDNIYDEIQGGLMNVQNNIQHAHVKVKSFQIDQYLSKKFFKGRLSLDLNSDIRSSFINQIDTSHYCYDFIGNKFLSGSVQGEIGSLPNDSHDKLFSLMERLSINYEINKNHSVNWNIIYKYSKKTPKDELADKYAHYPTSGYPNKLYSIISGISYGLNLFDDKVTNELGGKFFHYVSEVLPSNEINSVQKKPEIVKNRKTSIGWNEAIAWHPNPFFTLKASVVYALRMPTVEELFGNGMLIYPSCNLKAEKSVNMNIGINWLIGTSHPTFRIDLNGFYMNIDNMIKLMYSNMNLIYTNIGNIRNVGIEGEISSELTSWLNFKGNIAYLDARDVEKTAIGGGYNFHYNYRIPNIPYFFATNELDIHTNDIILKNSYVSLFIGSEFTEEFSYNWEASDQNTMIIPRKWIFYTGAKYFLNNRLHLSFEVHNLFDNPVWAEFRYPLPGRTFHFKIKYTI